MKKLVFSLLLFALAIPSFSAEKETPVKEIKLADEHVVVYYFHGWLRNLACTAIEEAGKKAVTETFKKDYEAGKITFRVFDIDKPDFSHYKDDYDFASDLAMVLVKVKGKEETKNKVLQKVAVLSGDEKKLSAYIEKEIIIFIKEE